MALGEAMILDTCALLWLVTRDKKLSPEALSQIRECAAVYVSAVSAFEIALKVAKRKLKLPLPPREWFMRAVEHHDLTVFPLTVDVCVNSVELTQIHDDPCDRFIIATAMINDLTVVTADERFPKYGVRTIV